jgi:orotate phosphoribosyltransferase
MANNNVIDILKKLGAVITDDHFVYTSGKHGAVYINKNALYPHTKETSQVGRMFAEVVKRAGVEVDVVVGPALGGIILSQWTAYHLSELMGKEVLGVYTEKDGNNQKLTRNYDKLVNGKRVLVVEDVATTGQSLAKTVQAVKQAGGQVVGAGAMVSRQTNLADEEIGAHFFALETLAAEAWDEDQMPQWLKDRPINPNVGHGKKYLQEKGLL